jgi:two-component system phosphate regulon sensor histidine kinase PhoR
MTSNDDRRKIQENSLHNWRSDINKQLLIAVAVCTLGFFLGQFLWSLVLLLAVYGARNYFQLYRLYKWLALPPEERPLEPPDGGGIWGDIYDGIYRMQKQERQSKAYLENIINKAQESSAALEMAVVMINKQGSLEWWNRAAEELLGFQYPQDRKQSVTNLVRDPKFSEYYSNQNYSETLKMAAPGDSRRILEYQIALFGEQERLMIVRDITQLQRLANMRKDFVANVSHELGTPITVIKGYLEAILDNRDSLEPRWHKPIEQMRQQSMRMENLVRDLLMLSSLETKTMPKNREAVDIAKLIHEIENDTRQMFTDKSHKFITRCEDNALVLGKRNELYSAISNLVVNAAKYTPPNGTIELVTRRDDEHYYVDVKDNGIGVEAHHLPRLTERFYRVDGSRASDSGGTGLGLAIVKHILLRHDGELLIESEYGKGSCFSCAISLERIRPLEFTPPVRTQRLTADMEED